MIDSLSLVQSRLDLKLNLADTAAMLSPYATIANSTSGLNLKVNIADTASMLSTYARTQRMIDSLSLVQSRLDFPLKWGPQMKGKVVIKLSLTHKAKQSRQFKFKSKYC